MTNEDRARESDGVAATYDEMARHHETEAAKFRRFAEECREMSMLFRERDAPKAPGYRTPPSHTLAM